jgi:hypothetical protein
VGSAYAALFVRDQSPRLPIDSAQALRATSNGIPCLAFAAIRRRSWCEQSPAVDHHGSSMSSGILVNQSAPQCFSIRRSARAWYRDQDRGGTTKPSSPDGASDIGEQAWLRRGLRGTFANLQEHRQPKLEINPQLESPSDSPKINGMGRCLGSCSPQGSVSYDSNRDADIRGCTQELTADGFDVDVRWYVERIGLANMIRRGLANIFVCLFVCLIQSGYSR